MVKQSFIGDMWKAAIEVKHDYELNENHGDLKITKHHVNGKYTYIITDSVNLTDNNLLLVFNIDACNIITTSCKYIEDRFNVDCQFFVSRYDKTSIIAGYTIT